MILPEVLLLLLDPCFNGMPDFPMKAISTLTRDAVNSRCFEAMIILEGLEETGDLPRLEAY
jgi:hypothetical protein